MAMFPLTSIRLPGARTSKRNDSSVPVAGVITMPPEDCCRSAPMARTVMGDGFVVTTVATKVAAKV